MKQLNTISDLHTYVSQVRKEGQTVSFVPTMGALHEGHLSLVRAGLECADICIPYIFLNPKQFAPHEDLDAYPKTLEADLEKLRQANAPAVYLPRADEIYPDGFSTSVKVSGITEVLEGEFRPHFFEGVTTIVTKMLLQCLPDIALFGEKDYQQLLVIKQLARDLNIPTEIKGMPTARDENGLALSSRNAYLSKNQLKIAARLNKILAGMRPEEDDRETRKKLYVAGFDKVDYCTIRDACTLQLPNANTKHRRALAAVWIGTTRLIDNMAVSE